jgi:hypothetical protein
VRVYLFGYLTDDFFGRVLVAPTNQSVGRLAQQLAAWGPTPGQTGSFIVTNEAGAVLDQNQTVAEAGLVNGDIFTVDPGG